MEERGKGHGRRKNSGRRRNKGKQDQHVSYCLKQKERRQARGCCVWPNSEQGARGGEH